MTLPAVSTTTGNVGAVPVSATTTTTETIEYHHECTLRLVVYPADNTVTSGDWIGDRAGCKEYHSRLAEAAQNEDRS